MGRQAAYSGSDSACAFSCAIQDNNEATYDVRSAGRVDPRALPARIDCADGMTATLEVKRVTFRRQPEGQPPLYITVPMNGYRGVVLTRRETEEGERIGLVLRHANEELDLPLLDAEGDEDVIADWQSWSKVLAKPPLMEDEDGSLVDPYQRFGALVVERPRARRANTFFRQRRPRKLMYRKVGGECGPRHAGEREIIART